MLYHVTEMSAVPAIMREGILPSTGPRSARLGEAVPAVYLFGTLEAVEDALMGWLGDEFDGEADLAVLEVDMDGEPGEGKFEVVVTEAVPPSAIVRVLDGSLQDVGGPGPRPS